MTVAEINVLIAQLDQEIQNGIDVELNTKWMELLKKKVDRVTKNVTERVLNSLHPTYKVD